MRASPACQVSLRRFGVWLAAVFALTAEGAAAMAAWLASRQTPISIELMMFAGLTLLVSFALAVSLWRVPAQSLRWDGKVWHLDTAPGELKVAVDLGPWMLLLFTPQAPGRASWLPVQRRGLEVQWHALRCAIHSPRVADQP